jgi:hypothetical protein
MKKSSLASLPLAGLALSACSETADTGSPAAMRTGSAADESACLISSGIVAEVVSTIDEGAL